MAPPIAASFYVPVVISNLPLPGAVRSVTNGAPGFAGMRAGEILIVIDAERPHT
jgi:hypothetical protein